MATDYILSLQWGRGESPFDSFSMQVDHPRRGGLPCLSAGVYAPAVRGLAQLLGDGYDIRVVATYQLNERLQDATLKPSGG